MAIHVMTFAAWAQKPNGTIIAISAFFGRSMHTERLPLTSRLLLPELDSDFAKSGDNLAVATSMWGHVIGLRNLTTGEDCYPRIARIALLLLLPVVVLVGLSALMGRVAISTVILAFGIAVIFEALHQRRALAHYNGAGGRETATNALAILTSKISSAELQPQRARPKSRHFPDRYARAFKEGTKLDIVNLPGNRASVSQSAQLDLPSGQLIIADPGTLRPPHYAPVLTVPVGSWPVETAVAANKKDAFLVMLRVRMAEQGTGQWRSFTLSAADAATFAPHRADGVYCLSVDSGTACLVDAAVLQRWQDECAPDMSITEQMDADILLMLDRPDRWVTAPYRFNESAEAMIVVTEFGGDGTFDIYIDYTADGHVAEVVIDFLTTDDIG